MYSHSRLWQDRGREITNVVQTGGPGSIETSVQGNRTEVAKGVTDGTSVEEAVATCHLLAMNTLAPVTKAIIADTTLIHNTRVTVYDTPGLQDAKNMDEDYLTKIDGIWNSGSGVDLILYCVEYATTTWLEDKKAVELLTKRYGALFWSKAIVVFTKVNQFQFSKPSVLTNDKKRAEWTKSCEVAFMNLKETFKQQLYNLLPAEHDRVDDIPMIAGGVSECEPSDRMLLFAATGIRDKDYLSTLWLECLLRLPTDMSRLAFLNATDPSTINSKRTFQFNGFELEKIVSALTELMAMLQTPDYRHYINCLCKAFQTCADD